MTVAARKPGLASGLALRLIALYQRWLSPLKGYRCAHSVLHGGTGCSGFAKGAIRELGLWGAIAPIQQRFRDCRGAMIALSEAAKDDRDPPEGQDGGKKRGGFCEWSSCAAAAPEGCCGSTVGAKSSAAGGSAGLCAGVGAGEAAGAGICAGASEGVAGVCGVFGTIGCCGG